jgi:dienelactone hydrolase
MTTAFWIAGLLAAMLAVLSVAVAGRLWRRLTGQHMKRDKFTLHRAKIEPHLQTRYPPGEGPFPVVLLFHGCGGVRQIMDDYAQAATKAGVAAIIVDSHAPRGIEYEAALAQVCTGRILWGRERAADVHAALAVVRDDPRLDADRIVLAGWSHGGWTLLDAFALNASGQSPDGLDVVPQPAFAGVQGVFLVYPYVSGPALARRREFAPPAPVEAVLVAEDGMANEHDAAEVFATLKDAGAAVTWSTLGGVTHGFDEPDHHPTSKLRYDDEATQQTRGAFVDFLKRRLDPKPI